ncbi:biliverdin-producing heme oxygenase [Arcobacter arenosus]|jgi:heme oxygenase|uniref:biliverdin-producing heme oxygenase n=1 Tax=Arcobacter arenosus TaxID=2576037 RepID=UPI003BA958CC
MKNNDLLKKHLKNITYPLHEWLEEFYLFEKIKKNNLSEEEYIFLLKKLYIFFNITESIIKKHKNEFEKNKLEDIEQRLQKTKWLVEDLNYLNLDIDNLNIKESIEFKTLNSFSSIVGALYVLEGSTMGGMQIVKMIERNFGNNLPNRYYQSYKQDTMNKWLSFSKWLDEVKLDKYEVTLGATETFIILKKHIES